MRQLAVVWVSLVLAATAAGVAQAAGIWCPAANSPPAEFDENTAVAVLEPAARAGDPEAMYALGLVLGSDQPARGAKWMLASARAGNTEGMVGIATLHVLGEGVPKSVTSARRWLLRASDRGDAGGMLLMGASYDPVLADLLGIRVKADYPRAVAWYEAAAARDCEDAARRLQYMYAEGEGVARDKPAADRWWKRVEEIQKANKAGKSAAMNGR